MTRDNRDFEALYPPALCRRELQLIRKRRRALNDPDGPSPGIKPRDIGSGKDTRVGFALSGGGIRSATFCLGVFQALAEERLLGRCDYLSTVSGGGYFGGFFGRMFTRPWIRRPGDGPENTPPPGAGDLAGLTSPLQRVESVLSDSASWCLAYLRDSGRYLSPRGDGDLWLAGAVFLRNWISLLIVVLTLPFTAFAAITLARATLWQASWPWYAQLEQQLLAATTRHLWWSPWTALPLVPLLLLVIPLGWAYWLTGVTWSDVRLPLLRRCHRHVAWTLPTLALVLGAGVWWAGYSAGEHLWGWGVLGPGLVAVVGFMTLVCGALSLWCARPAPSSASGAADGAKPNRDHRRRDWLSRWFAAALLGTLGLLALGFVDSLGQTAYALAVRAEDPLAALVALGGVTGLATLVVFARRLTLLLQRLPQGRPAQLPLDALAAAAAVALLVTVLTATSLGAHAIAWGGGEPRVADLAPGANLEAQRQPKQEVRLSRERHIEVVETASPEPPEGGASQMNRAHLLFTVLVSALVLGLSGQVLAFINLSSFHSFYTARLVQAYLGASNPQRWPQPGAAAGGKPGLWGSVADGRRTGDSLESDDISWKDYAPWEAGGPLHIVNATVNETVSGKSQIEYRDRKGLSMAVGPSGISVGRHSHAVWDTGRPRAGDRPHGAGPRAGRGIPADRHVGVVPLGVSPGKFHALGVAMTEKPGATVVARDLASSRPGEPHPCEAATLGRWVGISGAAFTTGLGARTSFGKSLLLGLLNVRLGYWWTSGVRPSRRKHARTMPRAQTRIEMALSRLLPAQMHLVSELFGRFHGPALYRWYLSDGGHGENTGAYELLRRRIPFVVICDCGCDRDHLFEDVANLVRRVRVDFGAEVVFLDDGELAALGVPGPVRSLFATPREFREQRQPVPGAPRRSPAHALLARVSYPGPGGSGCGPGDAGGCCSYLLILKPSLTGDEPVDVLHYQMQNGDFPNESTVDQNFGEAQWESYRRLGAHIAKQVFARYRQPDSQGGGGGPWQPRDLCPPSAPGVGATRDEAQA